MNKQEVKGDPAKQRRRRLQRREAMLVVALLTCSAGAGFLMVTSGVAASSAPPPKAFTGWLNLVVPQDEAFDEGRHRYQLTAMATSGGARPEMDYSLSVCGDGPTRGWILIGGDAKLSDPQILSGDSQDLRSIANLGLEGGSYPGRFELPDVQVLEFNFTSVPPCQPRRGIATGDNLFGVAASVRGQAQAPVVVGERTWPFTSPRLAAAMPLVGTFPGTSGNEGGPYRTSDNRLGVVVAPSDMEARAQVGNVSLSAILETSRPTTVDSSQLKWVSPVGVQPAARLFLPDTSDRLAMWQNPSSVVFGLFAGLAAALMADITRGRSAPSTAAPSPASAESALLQTSATAGPTRQAASVGAAGAAGFFLGWLVRRPRR